MPEIKWVGTNGRNFWPLREGQPVVAIVDHVMGRAAGGQLGTIDTTLNWFSSPASEVSAHFGISRYGTIYQYVREYDTAWANGILEDPDLSIGWLKFCVTKGINPNFRTISIEHEGDGILSLTRVQFEASVWLHKKLIRDWDILVDDNHIIGHNRITAHQKAGCPGKSFPWKELFKELLMDNSFDSNGHHVPEPIATYYQQNGGLPVFGLPVSDFLQDKFDYLPAESYQWFERARLEIHPDGTIMRGLVGAEALRCAGR